MFIPKIKKSDYNRERLTLSKIKHFFNILFNNDSTITLLSVDKFWDIDFEELKKQWKEWMILDVDQCIAYHRWNILPKNIQIIKKLKDKWWNIVIFSNMKKSDRYDELKNYWIPVITSKYAKPDKRGFLECLEAMWLNAEKVVMVWDNFLTDAWSINVWIDFIKVKPISRKNGEKNFSSKIKYFFRNLTCEIAERRENNKK